MFPRKNYLLLAICLLGGALIVVPAQAQHEEHMGGGDDHHQGMTGHMGDMHSDEMMEQMSTMMDHMTELVGEMHVFHDEFTAMWQHQEHAGESAGENDGMMHAMAEDMEEMLPYMDSMLKHMHSFMDQPHDEHMGASMTTLMMSMDTLLRSGRDVLATLHGMATGTTSDSGAETRD